MPPTAPEPPTLAPPLPSAPDEAEGRSPTTPGPIAAVADAPDGAPPDSTPAAGGPPDVPRDTTPTWELELLVSGAVLFGLFQLAALVEQTVVRWQPHVGLLGVMVTVGGGLLASAALYGLIGCFVVHLALRAYWVALVGAHSVFPGGPRWERMKKYGPMQTELLHARIRPLPDFIGRVDNAASVVFAWGFVFAVGAVSGAVLLVPAGLLLWAMERALGLDAAFVAAAALFLPLALWQVASGLVDYQRGERLDPASRLGRVVRTGLRLALATSPASVRSLSTVLTSNVPPRIVAVALVAGLALMGAVGVARVDDGGLPGASNFAYFADAADGSLDGLRYDNQRGDLAPPLRGPWIDADVVTGPYVRLSIPYRPLVHDPALAAACPGLRPIAGDPATVPASDVAAVLRCAERLHRIALDDRPLDGVRFHFLADVRLNRRVFVAYVPTEGLARGEHRLSVWPARRPDLPRATAPIVIPFWR